MHSDCHQKQHEALKVRDSAKVDASAYTVFPPANCTPERIIAADRNAAISCKQFLTDCSNFIDYMQASDMQRCALHCEQRYSFLVAAVSLIHCGVELSILPDKSAALLKTIEPGTALINDDQILKIMNKKTAPVLSRIQLPTQSIVYFLTSGSTGSAKAVKKSVAQLHAEIAVLQQLYPGAPYHYHSSVSHLHIYGFLFSCWWPFLNGHHLHSTPCSSPETVRTLIETAEQDLRIIGSPALWKRFERLYHGQQLQSQAQLQLFSSGGALPDACARSLPKICGTAVEEFYGSTETGGIARRRIDQGTAWQPLPGVHIHAVSQERCEIKSPFIIAPGHCTIDDRISMNPDGSFTLHGRSDTIVKLEEKRVSLRQIEQAICTTPFVDTAKCIKLKGQREYIAAVVILTQAGQNFLTQHSMRELHQQINAILKQNIIQTALPRKWRHVDILPVNNQGKTTVALLQALFEDQP